MDAEPNAEHYRVHLTYRVRVGGEEPSEALASQVAKL
jgi:hypothetical protein